MGTGPSGIFWNRSIMVSWVYRSRGMRAF